MPGFGCSLPGSSVPCVTPAGEVWQWFSLPDGGLEHEVHALAGSLNQPAFGQRLCKAAVARIC